MKISYMSDLHLEFGPLEIENTESADMLILAGDIIVADSIPDRRHSYENFFDNACEQFERVIYVPGNHEYYQSFYDKTVPELKAFLNNKSNLWLLDNDSLTIDDLTIIGATLWTDMNDNNANDKAFIKNGMNDFRIIMYNYPDRIDSFTPDLAIIEHEHSLQYIDRIVQKSDKVLVVTHHAPSYTSIDPIYAASVYNGAYASNLDDYIIANPNIVAWIHGHIHHRNDYMLGNTNVVSNPRGYYGREPIANTFKQQFLTI